MGYMSSVRKIIHHYLIPHESNNYRAKSLHISSLLFYITLLFLIQSLSGLFKYLSPNVLGYATDISIEKVLSLVNAERQKAGYAPLSLSSELTTAANQKGADMFSKNYWAHVSPTGTTPWEFITKAGYQYVYAGENLAKDFDTSEEVVKAWMNSPTHKANLLKPEYTEIGLSVMNGKLSGSETTLVVQEFGTRSRTLAKVNNSPQANTKSLEQPEKTEVYKGLAYANVPGFMTKRTISIIIAEFMLFVLFIDGIYIWKNKILRINGHTLSHIIFLAALVGAMSFTGIGVIL
jgi:hypothetical protein